MAKVTPISEHFQHFLAEMKESFWGDLYGQTRLAWQQYFELQSVVREAYQRRRETLDSSEEKRKCQTTSGLKRLLMAEE
jgi:hypothetical protein